MSHTPNESVKSGAMLSWWFIINLNSYSCFPVTWRQTQVIKLFFKCIFLTNTPNLQVKIITSFDAKLLGSKSNISVQHRLTRVFRKPLRGVKHTGQHKRETWNASLDLLAHRGLTGDVWTKEEGVQSSCYLLVQCGQTTVISLNLGIIAYQIKMPYISLPVPSGESEDWMCGFFLYTPKGKTRKESISTLALPQCL